MIWIIPIGVVLCVTLIILGFFIIKYIEGNRYYWDTQNIPSLTLKDCYGFIERYAFNIPIHEKDLRLYSEFKKRQMTQLAGTIFFRHPVLVIMDPEIVKNVLVKYFDHFINRRVFNLGDPNFEDMLINKNNQEWKDLRTIMSPTFTTAKIRQMFDIINLTGIKIVTYINSQLSEQATTNDDDCIEIRSICGKFTMDVIASTAFGVDSQTFENENSPFVHHSKNLQNTMEFFGLLKFLLTVLFPNFMKRFKRGVLNETSVEFLKNVVRDSIRQRKERGERRNDFLQLLLEAQAENKAELTDAVLIAQCNLFFVAGVDTTETLLMYSAYELAVNPEVQEKLYVELAQIIKDKGKFDYESIMELEYLDMIVSETLRKYSPGIRLERLCNKDFPVEGTKWVIKKGTHILVPLYAMHYDPDVYPEPQRFIPERFSSENKAKRHPYSYLPFGHGPRSCIAMRLALLEGKLAISQMVYNFKLSPGSKTVIPIKYQTNAVIKPKGGLWLNLKSRED